MLNLNVRNIANRVNMSYPEKDWIDRLQKCFDRLKVDTDKVALKRWIFV